MKWLNSYRMRLVLVGFVAAIVIGSGSSVNADFVIEDPVFMDQVINSPNTTNTQGHSLLHDGLKLYFSASREANHDARVIWVSERESLDAPWGEAVSLAPYINTPWAHNPTISPDDRELYFDYKIADILRLMRSTRASKDMDWGPATQFGELGDVWDLDFSPDGLTVYFTTWGAHGDYDICMATRETADAPWSEHFYLGPNVNNANDQWDPSISNDGLALFFRARPRRACVCVRATREDDWGPAIDIGLFGGAADGWWPEISPDGFTLYFESSSRPNSLGLKESFWQASIKPIVDFNGDETVDIKDLKILTDHWGEINSMCDIGPMPWGNGIVDVQDLLVLAKYIEPEVRDPALIAHWKLDEQTGETARNSVNGNNDLVMGDPLWQPAGGMVDGALEFDGIDDYISTPFVLNPGEVSFSIFAWIKGGMPGQVIISQAETTTDTPVGPSVNPGANLLGINQSDGALMTGLMDIYFGSLESDLVVTDGQWHHVGLVYDRTAFKRHLYVDGTEVAGDTDVVGGVQTTGGFYIGAGQDLDPVTFWSGLIDDVRVYDKALTAEQIAALAQ